MLESLLDAMVIPISLCTDDDELGADAGDGNDEIKVFELCASDTFENDMSEASLSRASSAMSVGSEEAQAGKLERASSMNSTMVRGRSNESLLTQIAPAPRRHNREYVSTIGLLPNSLKKMKINSVIEHVIGNMVTFSEHRCKQINTHCISVEQGCHDNHIEGN